MAFDISRVTQLCGRLATIDLFGTTSRVRANLKSATTINAAIDNGAAHLPRAYRSTYAAAVTSELDTVLRQIKGVPTAERASILERFYAPVYEQAKLPGVLDVRPELRRFLAVVSNLYRSFVNANKRTAAHVPLATATPPLAFFQSNGDEGPYTITSDSMQKLFATPVGVVSLPATYRDDALLWIDEAVADVYGVLNMGPTFAVNLAAFFSAMAARASMRAGRPVPALPFLRSVAGPRDPQHGDDKLDEHPVDLLRLHLAIGVIDSLTHLSAASKAEYIANIETVATGAAHGATQIRVQGRIEISHTNWRTIDETIPLGAAQQAARRVGNFLASAKLEALGNHSIQDIETWDDVDESTAQNVAARITANQSIVGTGDDALLLAGANIAVTARPDRYDRMTMLLNAALDDSYDRDPIWGSVTPDSMVVPAFLYQLGETPGHARSH